MPMTSFRAINRPSESPPKPTSGERPLLNAVSPRKRNMPQVQPSALPSVAVLLADKQSKGQSKDKGDLGDTVGKAKKTSQSSRKKKKRSTRLTSKPSRQQAVREKRLMHSIEDSPRKRTSSLTPGCGTDGAEDSDFVPSKADLMEISRNSTTNTAPRRSPRKHSSGRPNSRLLSQACSSPPVYKRESPPTPAPTLRARPHSPSIWSPPLRQRLYEKDEIVELPKLVFEYKQFKKEMRHQLTLKKEAMMAEKRKEKGKSAEQRSVETDKAEQKTSKRKGESQVPQNKPSKRQKSEKPSLEDGSLSYENKLPIGITQTSKHASIQRSPKSNVTEEQAQRRKALLVRAEDQSDIDPHSKPGIEARSEGSKNKNVQRSCGMGAKAQHFSLTNMRWNQSVVRGPSNSGQQKRPFKNDYGESQRRREVSIPENFRHCSCDLLPEYFTSNPNSVPCLKDWGASELEFFEHVRQISNCRGSVHPPRVVNACKRILEESGYPKRSENDYGRAQSSIPPLIFYGSEGRYEPPTAGSSSWEKTAPFLNTHSSLELVHASKNISNEPMPSKALSTRNQGQVGAARDPPLFGEHANPAVVNNASNFLTSPNSSPLGKRRITDMPNRLHTHDTSSGQGNVGVRQLSKTLPEAFNRLDRPHCSFDTQRQRHQSVPVNLHSRNTTIGERNPELPSPLQRHGNVPQEITNNALLAGVANVNRAIASLAEEIRRLHPAAAPAPIPAMQPAPIPAPIPNATVIAQADNGFEQPPPRRTKRPSHAERQLKQPKLDRNVAVHLRLPDEGIIELGRIVSSYERHRMAPYAFGWRGRLYAEYKHLLVRSVNGVPVWTADEINRLKS